MASDTLELDDLEDSSLNKQREVKELEEEPRDFHLNQQIDEVCEYFDSLAAGIEHFKNATVKELEREFLEQQENNSVEINESFNIDKTRKKKYVIVYSPSSNPSTWDIQYFGNIKKVYKTQRLELVSKLSGLRLDSVVIFRIVADKPLTIDILRNLKIIIRREVDSIDVAHDPAHCSLAPDKLICQLGFILTKLSPYSVSVFKDSQHIEGSPLLIPALDSILKEIHSGDDGKSDNNANNNSFIPSINNNNNLDKQSQDSGSSASTVILEDDSTESEEDILDDNSTDHSTETDDSDETVNSRVYTSSVKTCGYSAVGGKKAEPLRKPLSNISNSRSIHNSTAESNGDIKNKTAGSSGDFQDITSYFTKLQMEEQTKSSEKVDVEYKEEDLNNSTETFPQQTEGSQADESCGSSQLGSTFNLQDTGDASTSQLGSTLDLDNTTTTFTDNKDGELNFMNLLNGAGEVTLKSVKYIPDLLLRRSIGTCELIDGKVVASQTMDKPYCVKLFNSKLIFRENLKPKFPFEKPAAIVSLKDESFAVIDDLRIHGFKLDGGSTWTFQLPTNAKHYGLAEDDFGRIVTIQETNKRAGTESGSSLLLINPVTGLVEEKVGILNNRFKNGVSKCRFLSYRAGTYYVTDLGQDKIYLINQTEAVTFDADETINRTGKMTTFGRPGTSADCFNDPAGTAVDDFGNIIIADSKNKRLSLYSSEQEFVCNLKLDPPTRRPSDICISSDKSALLVLNLQGAKTMVRYSLKGAFS